MNRRIKLVLLCWSFIVSITLWPIAREVRAQSGSPEKTVSFNKEIAPIIFENCAHCHHPSGPAPFSLLTYAEVKKRAKQIAAVTSRRFMPPWLPESGSNRFAGERRLTVAQIRMIQQWVEQGTAEGVASDLPATPKFTEGWQLGQPDLVVRMPQPYKLAAEGDDVFRNFVIPVPVERTRYVRAVEILPGNKRIVHHANILIDPARSFRRRDEVDGEAGFAGMDLATESERFEPDSHFLFWKPGTLPAVEPDDMAWRLDKGTDLILNMHMRPSGKPEIIEPTIGLYFTERPPSRFPMLLQLEHDGAIDIPPGKRDFLISDDFTLPLDVDVLGIYPHAHYLGKDLSGFATLPDGTRKSLIRIKDWDLNWQAVYQYVKPVFLPKGTIVSMRYSYDNTVENVRNPNRPPQRVVAGDRSSDEMGHLWIQVLPRRPGDSRMILQEAMMRQRLRKYPTEFAAHFNLAAMLQSRGRLAEAVTHYRAALRTRPGDAAAHNNLGAALKTMGNVEEAVREFRESVRVSPDYASARYNLGSSLLQQGQPQEAAIHLLEVLRIQPEDAEAHNDLGTCLAIQNNLVQAAAHFEHALRIDPEHPRAHYNLGKVLAIQGKLDQAAVHFERAVRIDRNNADAHNDLGKVFAIQGNMLKAAEHFQEALRIDPNHSEARENLKRVRP